MDKDQKLALIFKVQEMAQEMRLAELQTKTVPWVDALHKMGRQILSLVSVIGVLVLLFSGHDLTQNELLAILTASAPTGIYNWVKGKGK